MSRALAECHDWWETCGEHSFRMRSSRAIHTLGVWHTPRDILPGCEWPATSKCGVAVGWIWVMTWSQWAVYLWALPREWCGSRLNFGALCVIVRVTTVAKVVFRSSWSRVHDARVLCIVVESARFNIERPYTRHNETNDCLRNSCDLSYCRDLIQSGFGEFLFEIESSSTRWQNTPDTQRANLITLCCNVTREDVLCKVIEASDLKAFQRFQRRPVFVAIVRGLLQNDMFR